jgi:hypothetical protein
MSNFSTGMTYKDVDSDWNPDLFGLITITADYNHFRQFLQQSAPTIHWHLNLNSSGTNWTISSSWSNRTAGLARLALHLSSKLSG